MTTYPQPMEGEPTFDLMARDPFAPALVRLWAAQRRLDVRNGHRPVSDLDQIERAERTAERMEDWRRDADEAWRNQPELPLATKDDVDGTPEADKDGWIAWGGGECPVDPDAVGYVRWRWSFGRDVPISGMGRGLRWQHEDSPSDIIAYKVVS